VLLVLASAVAVTTWDYTILVDQATQQTRMAVHQETLRGTGQEPDRYRVLVPFVLNAAVVPLARVMPYEKAFSRTYALYCLVAFTFALWELWRYLGLWFTEDQALVGTLFVAAVIRMALRQHYYQPASLLEPGLWALGLRQIAEGRPLAGTLAVATLNRETSVFLALLYGVTAPFTRRTLVRTAWYLALWAGIFLALRYSIDGPPRRVWTLANIWRHNIAFENLQATAVQVTLFLGAFWLFAILGYRRAPPFVRRTALILPLYFFTVAVWGWWFEVRLLMPCYPILVSLALSYVYVPVCAAAPALKREVQ